MPGEYPYKDPTLPTHTDGFTETSTGQHHAGASGTENLQEYFDRVIRPQEKQRLGEALALSRTAAQNQLTSQVGRNEELSRRLGISGSAQGEALGGALSASVAQGLAQSAERTRAQFDEDIQGFRRAELLKWLTEKAQGSPESQILGDLGGAFGQGLGLVAAAASGGGGGGQGDALSAAIDVPFAMNERSRAAAVASEQAGLPGLETGQFALGRAGTPAGADIDALGITQRAGGGGFGVETEEERRRRLGLG